MSEFFIHAFVYTALLIS